MAAPWTAADFERRFSDHVPAIMGVRSHYAVLAPLVEGEELSLLLEVRADTLDRQPGEVCFPGGRMEPGETPTQCAFRETWEELGLPPSAIRPLARLDLCVNGASLIHPVLALVDPEEAAHPNPSPDEVKETFLVPLSYLRENPPLVYTYSLEPRVGDDFPYRLVGAESGYRWRSGQVEVPIWNYRGRAIWGLTARILRHLLEQLEF